MGEKLGELKREIERTLESLKQGGHDGLHV